MSRHARDLVRFPGSGGAQDDSARQSERPGPHSKRLGLQSESPGSPAGLPASVGVRHLLSDVAAERAPSDEGIFLDRQPIWFKLAGAAALLYGAYLVGWSSAEPAQRTEALQMPGREIALTAEPPTPPVTIVAPATERPAPLLLPPPPPGARALSNEELVEVQAKLQALGHDPGSVDGFHGPKTVSAVKRYEIANQIEPTGNLDLRLLERLRRER